MSFDIRVGGPIIDDDDIQSVIETLRQGRLSGGIFAEKFESINKLLTLSDKDSVEVIKNKIRSEMKKGLLKDKIINDEDKILFYEFYLKVKKEFQEIEK